MLLSNDELNGILQELGTIASVCADADKRRSPRVKHDAMVVIALCPAVDPPGAMRPRPQATTVTLRNTSSRGLGILYHQPLACGDQFIVTFSSPTRSPVRLLCTIAHCRRLTAHQYCIGARFTRDITGEGNEMLEADLLCRR